MPEPQRPQRPQPAKRLPVPPPAQPAPGVRGTPPLPAGQLMAATPQGVRPVKLTDVEVRMLAEAGIVWKPGMKLPDNMAEILRNARAQVAQLQAAAHAEATAADLPPPVDPATPPLQMHTQRLEDMPPQQRAQYSAIVSDLLNQELVRQAEARQREVRQYQLGNLPQDVREAALNAERVAEAHQPPAPAGGGGGETQRPRRRLQLEPPLTVPPPDVVDDLAAYDQVMQQLPPEQRPANALPRASAAPPPPTAQPPPSAAESLPDLGDKAVQTHCPHCTWPLDQDDVPEPTYAEKMVFLHAILGQKPFEQSYTLLGGKVEVSFRSLTTQEVDAAFRQAYAEQAAGKLVTQFDFWERVNRMRLYLQLRSLRSDAYQHDLPDGLSRATNPLANALWEETDALPEKMDPEDTGLGGVEHYLLTRVLRTESLNRIVAAACNRFNRLVSRLEAMVDNSDFWQATGAPS